MKQIIYADLFPFKFETAKQAYLISLTPERLCYTFEHTFSFLLKLLMPLHALSFSASDLDSRSLRQKNNQKTFPHSPWSLPTNDMQQYTWALTSLLWWGRTCPRSQQQPTFLFVHLTPFLVTWLKDLSPARFLSVTYQQYFFPLRIIPFNPIAAILKAKSQTPLVYSTSTDNYDFMLCSTFQPDSLKELFILVISRCSLPILSGAYFIMLSPTQFSSEVTYVLHTVKFSSQF